MSKSRLPSSIVSYCVHLWISFTGLFSVPRLIFTFLLSLMTCNVKWRWFTKITFQRICVSSGKYLQISSKTTFKQRQRSDKVIFTSLLNSRLHHFLLELLQWNEYLWLLLLLLQSRDMFFNTNSFLRQDWFSLVTKFSPLAKTATVSDSTYLLS